MYLPWTDQGPPEKLNKTIFGLKVCLFLPKNIFSWQKYIFSAKKYHLAYIAFLPFSCYHLCGEKGWWKSPTCFPLELPASKSSPTASLEKIKFIDFLLLCRRTKYFKQKRHKLSLIDLWWKNKRKGGSGWT